MHSFYREVDSPDMSQRNSQKFVKQNKDTLFKNTKGLTALMILKILCLS